MLVKQSLRFISNFTRSIFSFFIPPYYFHLQKFIPISRVAASLYLHYFQMFTIIHSLFHCFNFTHFATSHFSFLLHFFPPFKNLTSISQQSLIYNIFFFQISTRHSTIIFPNYFFYIFFLYYLFYI